MDPKIKSNACCAQRQAPTTGHIVEVLTIIVSLYVLLERFGVLNRLVPGQLADARMGYGMLFAIGLATSVHCIAMCGGINLSQCIPHGADAGKKSGVFSLPPALMYNLGRVISYTTIGFLLGFVGFLAGGGDSAGVPTLLQGLLKLLAGGAMVIMGINMLDLFPGLRALQPRIPSSLSRAAGAGRMKSNRPLVVGLWNGLLPCGPLQSMQIVAVASGDPVAGALSMFIFSLGTVPLMLGLGSIVSFLGRKFTRQMMHTGAVLVVVLGLAMLSQGGSLSGLFSPDFLLVLVLGLCAAGVVSTLRFRKPRYKVVSSVGAMVVAVVLLSGGSMWDAVAGGNQGKSSDTEELRIVDGKQLVDSSLASGRYPDITVQAGIPVVWNFDAPNGSINGCNYRMFAEEYGIDHSFEPGKNVIEFTPAETGAFQYTCWMGMIRGTITVVEGDEV